MCVSNLPIVYWCGILILLTIIIKWKVLTATFFFVFLRLLNKRKRKKTLNLLSFIDMCSTCPIFFSPTMRCVNHSIHLLLPPHCQITYQSKTWPISTTSSHFWMHRFNMTGGRWSTQVWQQLMILFHLFLPVAKRQVLAEALTFCSQSSFRSSLWGEMLSHSMFSRSILLTPCTLGRPTSITLFGSTVSSLTLEGKKCAGQREGRGKVGVAAARGLMLIARSRMAALRNWWRQWPHAWKKEGNRLARETRRTWSLRISQESLET